MKTIIYLLLAIFIAGMLPISQITANNYVRIVIESADGNLSEEVLKKSSDIISARLSDAGIKSFEIEIEPGRIIVALEKQFANEQTGLLLTARGRFEFMEKDTHQLILEGKDIESIRVAFDPSDKPYAEIQFKTEAIPVWADATQRNLDKPIMILLDNRIICDPVVRGVIPNGSCVITGSFNSEELQNLAILGNNGELPAEFKIVK